MKKSDIIKRSSAFFVLAAALAMLVYGALCGGFPDVLNKAVKICYECIGIG